MAKKQNTEGFYTVTNKEIYDKLLSLEKSIEDFHKINEEEHNKIIIQTTKTNGKVGKSTLIGSTALTITLIILGWIVLNKIY